MCRDLEDDNKFYRADQLLEAHIEKLLEASPNMPQAEVSEHQKVMAQVRATPSPLPSWPRFLWSPVG
jgi:hypothetical protein